MIRSQLKNFARGGLESTSYERIEDQHEDLTLVPPAHNAEHIPLLKNNTDGIDQSGDSRGPSTELIHGNVVVDADALRLARMGYEQDMSRNFSVLSVLGVGFSLTNSWFGVSAGLITGINSGGPVLIVYGILIVFVVSLCIGASLSELASAMPSAAGQIFWARQLAPAKYSNLASYVTGWLAWTGSVFTSASVSLAMAYATVGCYQLSHPDFTIETWHIFVAYQAVNAFAFIFNCSGNLLPLISSSTLYISLISFTLIIITVPASAPTHQDAKFVFATFINNTGWRSNGLAFIVGLVNTNWAFACLDCATHMAEEVTEPEKMIPIAIMSTVAIGFLTAWPFGISMFFSITGDFQELIDSKTGVPILQLFYGATGNKVGAIILESMIISTGIGCLIATDRSCTQSRLCWSFARDRGIPLHKFLSRINDFFDVPLNAHGFSCAIVAFVGCLFLVSHTAFNSMITACIVLLYVSYAVPVVCLLVRGRDSIKPGPFWLGKLGRLANYVLIAWTAFTFFMYSWPTTMPVTASNMNYVSVVYCIIALIVTADWFLRGHKEYNEQSQRRASQATIRRMSGVGRPKRRASTRSRSSRMSSF